MGNTVISKGLTEEDRARFWSLGYLVLRNVIPLEVVATTRKIAADLLSRQAGREVGDFLDLDGDDADGAAVRLPQILLPVKYAQELEHSVLRTIAWAIARDLLGGTTEYQGEHIIAKPASEGARTLPHQDEAVWCGDLEYECISIWIPLQDVTEAEGCLRFCPGSHRGDVRPHRPSGGNPACNSFELVEPPSVLIAEPMHTGSLSIHHCRTIHDAGPNTGPITRYAYIYGFGLPTRRAARSREFPWQSLQKTTRQARADAGGYALSKMRPEV